MPNKFHTRKYINNRPIKLEAIQSEARPLEPGQPATVRIQGAKQTSTADERRAIAHQYGRSDVKRSLIIGIIVLIIMFIIYLIVRFSPIGILN